MVPSAPVAAPVAAPLAVCLGGLDPSGGAGLARDIQVLAGLGIHPMPICTAETLQNGEGCHEIVRPTLSPLACLENLRPHLAGRWGLKLGLCPAEPAELRDWAIFLAATRPKVRIWDPIQGPTSGPGLHPAEALKAMAEALLPGGGWVVSPNRLEAAALSGLPAASPPRALAEPLLERGAAAVWLKGGHADGDRIEDWWITAEETLSLGIHPRLPGDRRGTGCTLAAAWLGHRLRGLSDREAAHAAATQLRSGWERAFAPGGFGRPAFAPGAP